MPRKSFAAAVLLGLLTFACAQEQTPAGPVRYTVDVDAPSTPKAKIQYSAYFPGDLKAAPGDSVLFRNRATEAPHTITFGVKPDRSNQPPLLVGPGENPVAFEPCVSEKAPTDEMTKCPNKRLGAYDGSGYWNSGLLLPRPVPAQAGPKQTTVKLSEDIEAGSYAFVCVLHPFMNGNLEVVGDAADRSTRGGVRTSATEALDAARDTAEELETPKLKRNGQEVTAAAGWGDQVISVNRFAPDRIQIKRGQTVTWEIGSPYEPHTVTFGKEFDGSDTALFAPGGVKSGGDYTGKGVAHSGILGPEGGPFPESNYSLRFTKAGSYEYSCALHPGQTGVVRVTGG